MAVEKTIKLRVDTGNSAKKVKEVDDGIKDTGKSAKGAKGGLMGMVGGVKMLGAAFKAAGIGIIVALLVKLQDLFSGNINTARRFERQQARMAAMFDVIRDRIEPFFIAIMDAFENPKEAIKELWESIKQNISNRIQGLIDGFKGLGKIIKGVFTFDMELMKEGTEDAALGFATLNDGITTQERIMRAREKQGESLLEEMRREAAAADQLTLGLQKVRDMERDMLGIRAEANRRIAESRLLAEDDTKSNEERLEALKAAIAEEEKVAAIELDIQQKKIDGLQGLIDLGKSSEEDIQKLAEERARLIELQTASLLRQKRVVAEVGVFTSKVNTENAKAEKERLDRAEALIQAQERGLEVTEEMTSKQINAMIKAFDKEQQLEAKALDTLESALMSKEELELKAAETKFQKLIDLAKKYGQDTTALEERLRQQQQAINDKFDAAELKRDKALQDNKFNVMRGALGSISNLVGMDTKKGKKLAKAMAIIDMYKGANKALGQGGVLGFAGAAGVIATGLANINKITQTRLPGEEEDDDDSTVTGGAMGGIGAGFLPDMNVLNPPTGDLDMQPVQAFVVETDISNAQALQEELEIQATL